MSSDDRHLTADDVEQAVMADPRYPALKAALDAADVEYDAEVAAAHERRLPAAQQMTDLWVETARSIGYLSPDESGRNVSSSKRETLQEMTGHVRDSMGGRTVMVLDSAGWSAPETTTWWFRRPTPIQQPEELGALQQRLFGARSVQSVATYPDGHISITASSDQINADSTPFAASILNGFGFIGSEEPKR